MRVEIFMPRLGQSMEEGRILNWRKSIGAQVDRGEVIAEIETDKAVVDLEALASGRLIEIVVEEGNTVPTGSTIAIIDDGTPETGAETTLVLEKPQERSSEGRIKASPLARQLAKENRIELGLIQPKDPNRFITKEDVEAYLTQRGALKQGDEITTGEPIITPVARQLAKDHGIDFQNISGTGPSGRIVKADVEALIETQKSESKEKAGLKQPERYQLKKIKQTTARRMAESKATIPHFYASIEIEMSRSLSLRDHFKSRNVEVSINDLILRATTLALIKFPHLNATFAGDELLIYPEINIAVAIALEEGLISPVIHNCETLSLPELALESKGLIERARTGHLRPEDLDEGTFTVSNLGMFGVTNFQAIVNPPQAAILSVGVLRRFPMFDDHDRLIPAHVISTSVSADHRVTDGAEVARFLQEMKRLLEDSFELI